MSKESLFSAHFKKRETALKWFMAACSYCLMFACIEDPRYITISLIGKARIPLFCVYCALFGAGMLINTEYTYRVFKPGKPFLRYLSYGFNLCMGLVATTMMPEKATGSVISMTATIVHWLFGFGGIIVNATIILLWAFSLSKRGKNRRLKLCAVAGTVICVGDLVAFLLMTVISGDPQRSKNGIFEIIPLVVIFVQMYIINHTDLVSPRSERDAAERSLVIEDDSVLSSVCLFLLAAATLVFSTYVFVRNPIHYTISMTGVEYPAGFALTSVLISAALAANFILMFKRHGYKNVFVIALSIIGSLSLLVCVASPTTLTTSLNLIHSVCAVMFFYSVMAAILLFLIPESRQNKRYRGFAIGMAVLIAASVTTVVLLFIVFKQRYGRTGLTELIPLEYIFLFFFLENYTSYFSFGRKKSKQKKAVTGSVGAK